MIKINNISKEFSGTLVLDNIDLTFEKNNIIGLAGSSGSGKSTLLRCIQKLETIDSGSIEYEGKAGFIE